jgi:hypothetical protein
VLTVANGQSKQGWWVNDKYSGSGPPEKKEDDKDKDFFDMIGGDIEDAANLVGGDDEDDYDD